MKPLIWILRGLTFILFIVSFAIKNKKTKNIVIGIIVLTFISSLAMTLYPYINTKCYDRFGNTYNDLSEVVYYTEDNWQFKYNQDEMKFYCVKKSEHGDYSGSYDSEYVYIDKSGYLHFTDQVLDYVNNDDYACYDSETDEFYMDAVFARWNSKGELYHLGKTGDG